MKHVFVAGATGYLGRYVCAEYQRRGWYVTALVRKAPEAAAMAADQLVEAQATDPASLAGAMAGSDLVVSCLGITRQTDGLSYWDVDYRANLNLLREAEQAKVGRFAYVHVLRASDMAEVPMVAAKTAFVGALRASSVAATVIAPTGYFSDMSDVLTMAQSGRVWLFGDGRKQINPIHGADLAAALATAVEAERADLEVGGPDIFTQVELAELAFACLGTAPRVTLLPDILRRSALRLLPWIAPRRISGPARFFLSALALDMVGPRQGTRPLRDHFQACLAATSQATAHRNTHGRKTP